MAILTSKVGAGGSHVYIVMGIGGIAGGQRQIASFDRITSAGLGVTG